jgi:hypothetical protein
MAIGKRFKWLPLITFATAVLLMFIGVQFSLPPFTYLSLMFIGLTALLAGIQVIVSKEAFFLPIGDQALRRRSELYSGVAAQLWGIIFILLGLGFVLGGAAAVFIPEQAQATFDRLFDSAAGWGILITVIGIFIALYGLTRLLAGVAAVGSKARLRFHDVGYRLLGGFLLLLGVMLIGIGVLLLTAPEILVEFVMRLLGIP